MQLKTTYNLWLYSQSLHICRLNQWQVKNSIFILSTEDSPPKRENTVLIHPWLNLLMWNPQIQRPTVFTYWKKSTCNWACTVQTHFVHMWISTVWGHGHYHLSFLVQGSTVLIFCLTWVRTLSSHLLSGKHCANCHFLSLSFLNCKIEIIVVPTSNGLWEM